jgi:hypothetical protein
MNRLYITCGMTGCIENIQSLVRVCVRREIYRSNYGMFVLYILCSAGVGFLNGVAAHFTG